MTIFVPGPLTNPLNGSHGHWRKHWRWARDWRDKTTAAALHDRLTRAHQRDRENLALYHSPQAPKTVYLTAHTVRRWDPDNLAAGLKPVLDGLRDSKIIHDDGADCGHTFHYDQVVDPEHRGVQIEVQFSP